VSPYLSLRHTSANGDERRLVQHVVTENLIGAPLASVFRSTTRRGLLGGVQRSGRLTREMLRKIHGELLKLGLGVS
jgi:hypothetical protein